MAASWRVARSLVRIRQQADDLWPDRDRSADGTIGDADHQSRDSDHNPWYGAPKDPTVTAADITHDPEHGADMAAVAVALILSRDPRIKYLIFRRRIWDARNGWQPYTGPNPHDHHLHLSVVASPACDDTTPWALSGATTEEDTVTPEDRTAIAKETARLVLTGLNPSMVRDAHTEQMVAGIANRQVLADAADAARDAALATAVAKLSGPGGGQIDLPALQQAMRTAAEHGAADALARLQLSVQPD